MRIAIIGSRGIPALYGGFETATEEIGAHLAERGHEVTVYCRYGNGDSKETSYRGMHKVYVSCVKLKPLETLSHSFMALWHVIFHRYDVLIIMNPANGLLCWMPRLLGIPFALHVDGLDWERSRWPWYGRKFIRFGAWCASKLAPALIADSEAIANFYRQTWKRETAYASYGAEMSPCTDATLLEAYGLQPHNYFLVVARLVPENHTEGILQAYSMIDTELPLVIVGDTNYESNYIRHLKVSAPLGVHFLGGIYNANHLQSILHHSLLYLHGHSVGGTNPILLQAMACSCAIAYFDVNFNAEVMDECGQRFKLDDDSLKECFTDALNGEGWLEDCRLKAQARVAEEYTWERACDAYEQLCTDLHAK
jgi:glycosyltransferase involved in cell wall biosynthesis